MLKNYKEGDLDGVANILKDLIKFIEKNPWTLDPLNPRTLFSK